MLEPWKLPRPLNGEGGDDQRQQARGAEKFKASEKYFRGKSMKGGARPGAGRKPGTKNRRTKEKEAEIAASGLTPLEFMLSVMRDESAPRNERIQAARDAAPYVHARLSTVDMKADVRQAFVARLPEKTETVEQWEQRFNPSTPH